MAIFGKVVGVIGTLAVIVMTGCDGGGGSSSSVSLPMLNVSQAEANVTTGTEAATMIIGANYTGSIGLLSTSSTSEATFDPLTYVKQHVTKYEVLVSSSATVQPAASDSFTYTCESGTISYSVSTNDSGTSGSATIVYDQCSESGVVMDGTIKMSVTGTTLNDYDYTLLTSAILFATDFTVTYESSAYTIHLGTYINDSYTIYDYNTGHIAGTETSSLWIDYNGNENYRYDDLTVEFDQDYYTNDTMTACYKSGRVYVENLTAYLDINAQFDPYCEQKFMWDYSKTYPLYSGTMEFLGSNGSKVLVMADPNSNDLNVTVE